MGYSYGYGYGIDWTYLLIIVAAIISLIAQALVKSTFSKYSKYAGARGLTGAQTAEIILRANGINDVSVQRVSGSLTDHYDPKTKTVNLSETVYDKTSVAAVGVAAHECGHAIQHDVGYVPLSFRSALVPVANIGSQLSWVFIIIGLVLSYNHLLITIGIFMFSLAVLFQLVTLPVEFNASARALDQLEAQGILDRREIGGTRKVLTAAAMTYVASAASAVLQLLRLILLFGGNNKRGRR
jgi:hypothetical protein